MVLTKSNSLAPLMEGLLTESPDRRRRAPHAEETGGPAAGTPVVQGAEAGEEQPARPVWQPILRAVCMFGSGA